ncbi:MAG: hypothetical protein D4R77_02060, partial [Planctomycetaceae bacterium]
LNTSRLNTSRLNTSRLNTSGAPSGRAFAECAKRKVISLAFRCTDALRVMELCPATTI